MTLDRRNLLIGSVGLGAGLASASAGPEPAQAASSPSGGKSLADFGIQPDSSKPQTQALQKAIDAAVREGLVLHIPAGEYHSNTLHLPTGAVLSGVPGHSILKLVGSGSGLRAENADSIRLSGLILSGDGASPGGGNTSSALFSAMACQDLRMSDCRVERSTSNGIALDKCSGSIRNCVITGAANTGLFCNDSTGLDISHNHVHGCGNNGIQVWRSKAGEDGTIVANNRVEKIAAKAGGSGQNGNGINIFRAGNVQVSGNRISDCAFSAIRGNAASNLQMLGNNCSRLGEVAIYAEFGFEGAVIANNLVDDAATGISITNFNEGGRMAVAQGNLIRNLKLRDGERGVGIAVEADAAVTGNLIEGAPGGGIMIGWGKHQRDVNTTGNLVRDSRIGIGVSVANEAGYAYITNNMITGAKDGGIRAMDHKKPLGPDLARTASESYRNIAVFGNVSL